MILWHFTRCGKFSEGLMCDTLTGVGSIPAGGPYS